MAVLLGARDGRRGGGSGGVGYFDDEPKCFIGRNARGGTVGTVGLIAGDAKQSATANFHAGYAIGPAFDDARQRDGDWLTRSV